MFQKKIIFLILIIIASVLLTSCDKTSSILSNLTKPAASDDSLELPLVNQVCTLGWNCLDNESIVYLLENCTKTTQKKCPNGCADSACLEKKCEIGLKCKGSSVLGFQTESCNWTNEKKCEYGCFNATCLDQPMEPNITISSTESAAPQVVFNTLNLGEVVQIDVEGEMKDFFIYELEPDRVRLMVGPKKSDWLTEGGNFTYGGSSKIVVKGIYFQGYEGGIKAVDYVFG